MNTDEMRTRLHDEIEHSDERLLKIIFAIVKEYQEESDTDSIRKQLVREDRAKYLRGEGKSYTWDEVRDMAINKEKRDGL